MYNMYIKLNCNKKRKQQQHNNCTKQIKSCILYISIVAFCMYTNKETNLSNEKSGWVKTQKENT